jgi:hypothetical protein
LAGGIDARRRHLRLVRLLDGKVHLLYGRLVTGVVDGTPSACRYPAYETAVGLVCRGAVFGVVKVPVRDDLRGGTVADFQPGLCVGPIPVRIVGDVVRKLRRPIRNVRTYESNIVRRVTFRLADWSTQVKLRSGSTPPS